MNRNKQRILALLGIFVIIFFGIWIKYNYFDTTDNPGMKLGVSFDPEYAGSLQLDPANVFKMLAYDWKFKYFRMPLHWDKVESEKGKFNFSEMDYYVKEAERSGAKVMLAIGNKTPRWPECHIPKWAGELHSAEYHKALENYLLTAVEHFKNNSAVEIWQVENEPFLQFGNCLRLTNDELRNEISLVKQVDPNHPVLVADSGELTLWNITAKAGDLFGMTMYRVVWNKYIGYWNYDWLPAAFYRLKLALVGRPLETSFVVELQAEPWAQNTSLDQMTIQDQGKSMDLARFKKNLNYVKRVGVDRAYLWGGEWWSWLEEKGYKDIPDFVRTLNP